MKKYTDSHEWIKVEGNIATLGISAYALKEIGEIVNIQLPKIGSRVEAKQQVCVLESTKSAIDIYAPISGIVVEINEKLNKNLEDLNKDPEKKGWLFKMEISDLKEIEDL